MADLDKIFEKLQKKSDIASTLIDNVPQRDVDEIMSKAESGTAFDEKTVRHAIAFIRKTNRICKRCGITDVHLKCCSKCKIVYYCSQECQKQHWPSHKRECVSKS